MGLQVIDAFFSTFPSNLVVSPGSMGQLLSFVPEALVWAIATSLLLHWWANAWLPSKKLPPGPKPWPLVGSLFTLRRLGSNHLTVSQQLESKYGKIVTFWIGQRPLIVINDPELAHEALVKQGANFANRSMLTSIREVSNNFSTISTSNGAVSTMMRKNLFTKMLSPKAMKIMSAQRDATLKDVIKQVGQAVAANGGSSEVQVSPLIRYGLLKLALYKCFGVDLGDPIVQKVDDIIVQRVRSGFSLYVGDYIPLWRYFERKNLGNIVRTQKKLEELFLPIIQRVRELKRAENVIPGTYLDTLLDLQEIEGYKFLHDRAIVSFCVELIIASTHTTASACAAGMSVLSERPDIQTALINEIKRVAGNQKQPVEESHLIELPYLSAFGAEVLRLNPPLPTTIPHATVEPCKLGGYDIPTNAVLCFHIKAYQLDPKLWADPMEFRPERHIGTNVDFTGTRNAKLIPFGAGRRICPGIHVGVTEMSMMTARLVQNFEWKKDPFVSNGHPSSTLQGSADSHKRSLYAKVRRSD